MKKSVEQKLFEAYQQNRGVRLTADDVTDLLNDDDAIGTRISNVAAEEAGAEFTGCDNVPRNGGVSWEEFKKFHAELT